MKTIIFFLINQLTLSFILPTFLYLILLLVRSRNRLFFYVFLILLPALFQILAQNIILVLELVHRAGEVDMDPRLYLNLGYISFSFFLIFYVCFSAAGTMLLKQRKARATFVSVAAVTGIAVITASTAMFQTDTESGRWILRSGYVAFYSMPFIYSLLARLSEKDKKEQRLSMKLMVLTSFLIPAAAVDSIFFLNTPSFSLISPAYIPIIAVFMNYLSRYFSSRYESAGDQDKTERFYTKFQISEREQEVIRLLIPGTSNRDIADRLCISQNTVKTHIKNIYRKADVGNRYQLVNRINETVK